MMKDADFKMTDAWWGFNTWIARQIADAAELFISEGSGHPGDMNEEAWKSYVKSVGDPLREYAEDKYTGYADEKEKYAAAQVAMHKFADRLGSWWD